jgi:hypothetical protein
VFCNTKEQCAALYQQLEASTVPQALPTAILKQQMPVLKTEQT